MMVAEAQRPDRAASTPQLVVKDLRKQFDLTRSVAGRLLGHHQYLKAIDGIDIEIARGTTFSLVGESGCGKSTVARCIVGIYKPTSGQVLFDGADIAQMRGRKVMLPVRRRMQMIFQDPYASLNPRWRVSQIIAEPIRTHGLLPGRRAVQKRVDELLVQVGLAPGDGRKYPHEFSGGQRQRISIARALASSPDLIVCDEPTSALDVSVQAQILNLLRDLQEELGLTYLLISHNLAVVAHMSTRLGVMYLGRLVETGDSQLLFGQPMHPYTRMLLSAVPDVGGAAVKRVAIAGDVPNPINPPSGCSFHPRCPFVQDKCRMVPPVPSMVQGRLVACHVLAEHGELPA